MNGDSAPLPLTLSSSPRSSSSRSKERQGMVQRVFVFVRCCEMSCSGQTSLLTVPSSVSARAEGTLSLRWPNTGASPSACGEEGRSVPPCDDRRSVVRGTLGWRTGGGRCRLALYPPEEVAGRDGPLAPVVREKDMDGPNSLPLRLDGEVPNLGKFAACRRVARSIYLGLAPTATAANLGLEDRRIKLGCVMPGESPAIFGDALRRLSGAATYLYQDAARYWYSTQPTVTKIAEDRAEQLKRDPDAVSKEIDKRLRTDLRGEGDFRRIHPLPQSGQDVPDDLDARLVVLGIEYPYSRDPQSSPM
jgi:hypothetical protein